jgi:hypothetical protein
MHKSQALAIYALVMTIIAISTVTALLTTQRTIQGSGSIKGVGLGIYWDPACTNTTSSLDFGQLEPGSSKNFTLFLRNEGNSAFTLNMTTENWNPTNAIDYLTLTWNREGQQVNPDEVVGFVIILSVSEDITGISTFSFDIIISGTG